MPSWPKHNTSLGLRLAVWLMLPLAIIMARPIPPSTVEPVKSAVGPEDGRLMSMMGDDTNTLNFVERLNFGATFSPIDGLYMPTEATFNLMFVLDIPMFRSLSEEWLECVKDRRGRCVDMNTCELLNPESVNATLTSSQNKTCELFSGFMKQLRISRQDVAQRLISKLESYVKLSVQMADLDSGHVPSRQKRLAHNDNETRNDGDSDLHSALDNVTKMCLDLEAVADKIQCMSMLMEFEMQSATDLRKSHRFARDIENDIDRSRTRDFAKIITRLGVSLNEAGQTATEVDQLLGHMVQPHLYSNKTHHRARRGLFNLGGKILSSLFGVVTADEAEDMKHAISALSANQFKIGNRLKTFEKRVVAVANLTNEHLKGVNVRMGRVETEFENLFKVLQRRYFKLTKFASFASASLLSLTQDVANVQNEVDQFLNGLRSLKRSELSIDLIAEDKLRKALHSLQGHIVEEFPYFTVSEMNPTYYYKYAKPAYSWENGTLIVYLSVPLRSTQTAFKLYQVSTFNIPADSSDSLETRLILENDIFGLSHDGINFLEMSKDDLQSCTLSKTIRCEMAVVIRDVYHKSCLLSIYENDKSGIDRLCHYRLEAAKPVLGLKSLAPGRVLVSNAKLVSVQCPKRPAVSRPGCTRCVWTQRCGCSITATDGSSKSITLSPTLHGCLNDESTFQVQYPVNYPALSRFLDPAKLNEISHTDYANSAGNLPDIDIKVHPLAREISVHERYDFSMDLDEAFRKLQEDSVLNPFSLDKITQDEDSVTWLLVLTAFMGTTIGLALLFCLAYVAHKRGLFAIIRRYRQQRSKMGLDNANEGHENGVFEEINLDDIEAGNDGQQRSGRQVLELRRIVAQIIHDYAAEAREAGMIPPTLAHGVPPQNAGRIYPTLPPHHVDVHVSAESP